VFRIATAQERGTGVGEKHEVADRLITLLLAFSLIMILS
jgi:hypothetical protein